jgi:NADP-dependent 3-hydroxy acid dehydrogenase YdfG
MLLEKKNAVIYGAGGGIGGGVARTFAREGARVFLTGRRLAPLQALAEDIRAAGGSAEVAEVDATDERAVGEHAAAVVADGGSIDVSFNLISCGDVQRTPLDVLRVEGGRIAEITTFGATLFPAFGRPATR